MTNFLEGPVAAVAYRLCGESGGYTPLPGSYLPAGRSVLFAEEMQPECFDLVALDAQQRVVGVLPNVERGASSRWVLR